MSRDYKESAVEDAYEQITNMTDDELKAEIARGEALIASVPMVRSKIDMLRGFLVGRTVGRDQASHDADLADVVAIRVVEDAPDGDESEG